MNDLERRLGSLLLTPYMETTSEEEPKMYKEITPKEYQADRTNYTDTVEISQQDRTMGSIDKQLVFANFLESTDSQGSG